MKGNAAYLSTTLYETVCPKRLAQLIKCPEIEEDIKKDLQKYAKKFDRSKLAYRVNYEYKGLQYGRRYAEKSLSLQNFKGKVRETLVHDTHTDIDIKNCHPVLLAQYCEQKKIACDALNDYVKHRDARIQELVDAYKCDRKTAKTFMIHLLYLDQIDHAQLTLGFEMPFIDPPWVVEFAKELQLIGNLIVALEPVTFDAVKKLKKEEYKNKIATTMSYVIQVIEDQIIQNAVIKLKQNNYKVDTLCFDGVLVNSTNVSNDVLEELSSYCYSSTGYVVEFAKKPMESHYSLVEEKYDFSERKFLNLDHWSQVYCMSLEGWTPEETYALRKTYFEKHFCMVETPSAQYIRQGNGDDKKTYILTAPEMTQLLKPVKSGFTDNASRLRFFSVWDEDIAKRQYRQMDFIPYNPSNPIDDDSCFNLFQGFNPRCFGNSMEGSFLMKKIKPFLDLAHEICGGVEENSEYFHRFMADIFQNPAKKPPVAICIKSKEGVGKNVLLDAIGNMLGNTHYITSSKPDDFFGCHAEGFKGKLLINLNEAEGGKTFDYEGNIKSFITEDTITINPKNVRPMEINNYARTIVTTNKTTPIAIDVKGRDRRWVVFQSTENTLTYSRTYWSKFVEHFKSQEFMAALYQYYTEVIDNTGFDWAKQRPITKAYCDMCDKYQPVVVLFLEEYIRMKCWKALSPDNDGDQYVNVPTMDLFEAFNDYKKLHLFTRDSVASGNSRSFQGQLMELGLPIDKHKTHGDRVYRLVPDTVYDTMEAKNMINTWRYDMAERQAMMDSTTIEAPDDLFV